MSDDLKNIYAMAKRYNKHGVVKDETLKEGANKSLI